MTTPRRRLPNRRASATFEAAAPAFARQKNCLFAPSTIMTGDAP
jgi:hypothetical protein